MTGLRVGYIYSSSALISAVCLAHEYIVACTNSLSQCVALAALKGPQSFVTEMVAEFDKRRHLVHERPNSVEGFRCKLLEGAVYAFPNIKAFGMCSEEFSEFLRKNALS
jgi:aminotransferase